MNDSKWHPIILNGHSKSIHYGYLGDTDKPEILFDLALKELRSDRFSEFQYQGIITRSFAAAMICQWGGREDLAEVIVNYIKTHFSGRLGIPEITGVSEYWVSNGQLIPGVKTNGGDVYSIIADSDIFFYNFIHSDPNENRYEPAVSIINGVHNVFYQYKCSLIRKFVPDVKMTHQPYHFNYNSDYIDMSINDIVFIVNVLCGDIIYTSSPSCFTWTKVLSFNSSMQRRESYNFLSELNDISGLDLEEAFIDVGAEITVFKCIMFMWKYIVIDMFNEAMNMTTKDESFELMDGLGDAVDRFIKVDIHGRLAGKEYHLFNMYEFFNTIHMLNRSMGDDPQNETLYSQIAYLIRQISAAPDTSLDDEYQDLFYDEHPVNSGESRGLLIRMWRELQNIYTDHQYILTEFMRMMVNYETYTNTEWDTVIP